ncbi:hypothetical protein [Corynebacterium bovis]|uniref:Uncharacterized protein n=1 Tax=Corynebacterium bovis DSM 20582 = CIP 54.80 TaxID=927655 RepID=A0A8I0CM09_9CORY|nr:hypothetical protein [Corynebacterium bovis]MBB3115199.1 hypothetical protein [Corynebacterium bovis DSM 20582 = CIP 54.80]QQC47848.1 hypothetical protein I6I09_02595 [Corynebacterium bovis]WJY77694.1 hypothetical protein CBOVI_05875 [Corynebacterium bovis DSM 20582 = CIP 54.80]
MDGKKRLILKASQWWATMALGLLVYFAAIRPHLLGRPFSWQSWGEAVLLGTLAGVLFIIYSRPRK